MKKNLFIISLQQELCYIIVLLTGIMVEYFITPNYFQSSFWGMDAVFLLIQVTIFIAECLLYLKGNDVDTQEERDINEEEINSDYESGYGRVLLILKPIITKGMVFIIVVRIGLHIIAV